MKVDVRSLPYPVTIVCFCRGVYPELFDGRPEIPDTSEFRIQRTNNDGNWTAMTYIHLKKRGYDVAISDRFVPGALCVACTLNYGIRHRPFDSFVVGCRSDGPRPNLCDFTIVQNEANVDSKTTMFIPHWPQPGLIPRSKDRGHRLERLAYKGANCNLYETFRTDDFKDRLAAMGVYFQIDVERVPKELEDYYDYSSIDLCLAVRDLTANDALVKPASKLINAWLAGVPALLGPEPAFRDLRQSELDYIEIKTPQDALDAIARLKAQPLLYEQMVAQAQKRAADFTEDRISQRWVDALAGPIADEYGRWLRKSRAARLAVTPIRYMRQRMANRSAIYHRHHGYRIVSGQVT